MYLEYSRFTETSSFSYKQMVVMHPNLVAVFYSYKSGGGQGRGGGSCIITGSQTTILPFTCHETNFTFSRFSKIEVVQNV